MNLTEEEAQAIGAEEEERWRQTHSAVVAEVRKTKADFHQDRRLARDLTSQIVATRRDEDKAALASDEAVAHGLARLRKNKSTGLESLAEQPYFARVVTEEGGREIEFRLGTASFPDQRIVDWRKAPISRLYYDYKEGDEFEEVIQGRDRNGRIRLRRSYRGMEDELHRIETPQGVVTRGDQGWRIHKLEGRFSRDDEHDGHLPPILSFITAEQFGLITRDAQRPVVIQGIAGSGKTTVALHRLAWLLHEENSPCRPERCLVVMYNRALKTYVETTLPELHIDRVPIRTFSQWAHALLNELIGPRPRGAFTRGLELELFKSSALCLQLLQEFIGLNPKKVGSTVDCLFAFYGWLLSKELFWRRWDLVRVQLKEQSDKKICDFQDDPLLLHLIYAEHGYYPAKSPDSLGVCDHIVIDEAQDFGVVEIRALLNAVDRHKTLTIVGDVAQKITAGRDFGGWDALLREAGFQNTTPISLTVSYRSTSEIMKIASALRGPGAVSEGHDASGRQGPAPTFQRAENPAVLPHRIARWIEARQKDSPRSVSAIICRWPKQAQELVEQLRKMGHPAVRLGHRDQFEFSPGVTVTNAHQVKGLEFRNVLIVEPSEENYKPASEEERNLLYVAVTRAELRLDFIGSKKPTPLLPRLHDPED